MLTKDEELELEALLNKFKTMGRIFIINNAPHNPRERLVYFRRFNKTGLDYVFFE